MYIYINFYVLIHVCIYVYNVCMCVYLCLRKMFQMLGRYVSLFGCSTAACHITNRPSPPPPNTRSMSPHNTHRKPQQFVLLNTIFILHIPRNVYHFWPAKRLTAPHTRLCHMQFNNSIALKPFRSPAHPMRANMRLGVSSVKWGTADGGWETASFCGLFWELCASKRMSEHLIVCRNVTWI